MYIHFARKAYTESPKRKLLIRLLTCHNRDDRVVSCPWRSKTVSVAHNRRCTVSSAHAMNCPSRAAETDLRWEVDIRRTAPWRPEVATSTTMTSSEPPPTLSVRLSRTASE